MTPHPSGEEIQDLLDGRLVPTQRAEIEAHLAECALCQHTLATLAWARQAAAQLPVHEPPPELQARVALVLNREARPVPTAARRLRRVAWAMGLVAVAAAAAFLLVRRSSVDLPAAVARAYAAYETAAVGLDTATADAAALEAFFARHGITFPTRVFDLGMMGFRVVGGRTHMLAGRPSALFVYRGANGQALMCQMYEGTLAQLPAGGETREHNGIAFRVYRSGAVALVFWQEGRVVCVLASDAPVEEVVQLAYAKATKSPV